MTIKYKGIQEAEIKNKVARDYFGPFDSTRIIGNIDFCISLSDQISFLWAEAKRGQSDLFNAIVQLILTIGKARTFDNFLPPIFLGAFDAEKIAFVPYSDIHDVFYLNDFNWKVAPSNYETKEFKLIHQKVKNIIENNSLLFNFIQDNDDLREFIKNNFLSGKTDASKTRIDKNNFVVIYNKWLAIVKPTIAVSWDIVKKSGIIDGDFYLADLLSHDNETLKEKLYVLLRKDHYEIGREIDVDGLFNSKTTSFTDKQKAHIQFWNKYERPPKEEYWDYIVERRDLLVPQNIRERKGSYFTPQIWVELSQKYIADVLGEDWQDDYYVWDLAAGTGNLLAGLTNKYNIWASTIDKQDIDIINDRIKNGTNLLESHVFQFDFLNDDFIKLPKNLQDIINDPLKRKKLVVYINPPYAEVSSIGIKGKAGVNQSKMHDLYISKLGTAGREIYIHFLARIYSELNGCTIAEFSKMKTLQGSAFEKYRDFFNAKLQKSFIVPAYTFDNVVGEFPIGFKIWDTSKKEKFIKTSVDVYDDNGKYIKRKVFINNEKSQSINKWITKYKLDSNIKIGFLAGTNGNDFQQNKIVYILNKKEQMANPRGIWIVKENIIPSSIYFAIRKCIEATWFNDRDQFLIPNNEWQTDIEFQNDCLTYTLFTNNIQSKYGLNYWIPYTEDEVGAKDNFKSHFMVDYINGKLKKETNSDLFQKVNRTTALRFSLEAKEVFKAGKQIWKYYHQQPNCNVNASLYDIREYFQGRNEKGKMNNKSEDECFTGLIKNLRYNLKIISKKIEPKIYEYGFLKE